MAPGSKSTPTMGLMQFGDARRRRAAILRASQPIDGGAVGNAPGHGVGDEGLKELAEIATLVRAAGYGPDRIRIDPSVVRGLEYYTGPVFEAELTFETPGEDGRPIRFGSVGGGGRYDGLVARFRAEPVPGDRLFDRRLAPAWRRCGRSRARSSRRRKRRARSSCSRSTATQASMANYQRLVASLRAAGIAAELYLGSGGMNAQLKYADRRRSRGRRHPGLERARRAGRAAGHDPRSQARRRTRQGDQGPRRLSRIAQTRAVLRARGRAGRARARGAGAGIGNPRHGSAHSNDAALSGSPPEYLA